MTNEKIKEVIKKSGFYKWQIANQIGICEMTLIRWLRTELSEANKKKIITAIKELKEGA